MLAGAFLAAGASPSRAEAAPATAARDCGWSVLNDYFPDETVNRRFRVHCFRLAIAHLQEDQKIYGNVAADLRRYMQLALLQRGRGSGASDNTIIPGAGSGGDVGGGGPAAGGGRGDGSGVGRSGGDAKDKGFIDRAIDWIGPQNADEIPLPLLVLGGLALLLLLAAGTSFLARRIQARRATLAEAPAAPPKQRP